MCARLVNPEETIMKQAQAMLSRRQMLRWCAFAGANMLLGACGQSVPTQPTILPALTPVPLATVGPILSAIPLLQTPTVVPTASVILPTPPVAGPLDLVSIGGMRKLTELAKAEAALSTIALPDDWAQYGEIKRAFFKKYPFLRHTNLNPDASSPAEIETVRLTAGNTGSEVPDALDIGLAWATSAQAAGLIQPYRVAAWDDIPAALKDSDGYWYGGYYGAMVFEVNTRAVAAIPRDWADLLKPEYQGLVALAGDPAASVQAFHAIWAAAYGNGGSLNSPTAGLEFFRKLIAVGNFNTTLATPITIAKGETPIALRWDFNARMHQATALNNPEIAVVIPASGTLAGVYVQAINAYSPRPYAARLWMEYLYSDEVQLRWLQGYVTPVRLEALRTARGIPAETRQNLPAANPAVAFPTSSQINRAADTIRAGWPAIVAGV
jgi:putative spermidine/putrescine transport system substrate-binding protein